MFTETHRETDQKKEKQFEAEQNLFGFFGLLLEIDKRINPEEYRKQNDIKQC